MPVTLMEVLLLVILTGLALDVSVATQTGADEYADLNVYEPAPEESLIVPALIPFAPNSAS